MGRRSRAVAVAAFAPSGKAAVADSDQRDVPVPVIDVWVDARDQVVRLAVAAGGARPSDGTPAGWTIDYETAACPVDLGGQLSADRRGRPADRPPRT